MSDHKRPRESSGTKITESNRPAAGTPGASRAKTKFFFRPDTPPEEIAKQVWNELHKDDEK